MNYTYSKVKEPERRGRVRCLGKLPRHASSNVSSKRTNSEDRLQKVKNVLGNLVVALQMRFYDDPKINVVTPTLNVSKKFSMCIIFSTGYIKIYNLISLNEYHIQQFTFVHQNYHTSIQ